MSDQPKFPAPPPLEPGEYRKGLAIFPAVYSDPAPFEFEYTNYRGETRRRRAIPIRVYFGSNEWHLEPQWLMVATDLDKGEIREFAMGDMRPTQGGSNAGGAED